MDLGRSNSDRCLRVGYQFLSCAHDSSLVLIAFVPRGALFKTLLSGATPCIAAHLRKSRDTPQEVIKEQRPSWKN